MPQQVPRLIAVLVVLVGGLLVARYFLVPPTFGKSGHFREAAIDSVLATPVRYAGQAACVECHDDVGETKADSRHRGLSCEICHGPAAVHAEDPDALQPPAPRERGYCPLCHGYNASRPTGFPQIDPVSHNPLKPCITCHDPHEPVTPHVPEECSACHGQIARTKAVSHHAALPCTQCHVAPEEHKTTPRQILPSKPEKREVCGTCHGLDADAIEEIPKIDMDSHGNSYVCWQCHYPHYPGVE